MDSVSQPSEDYYYKHFLKEASRPPRSDRQSIIKFAQHFIYQMYMCEASVPACVVSMTVAIRRTAALNSPNDKGFFL